MQIREAVTSALQGRYILASWLKISTVNPPACHGQRANFVPDIFHLISEGNVKKIRIFISIG